MLENYDEILEINEPLSTNDSKSSKVYKNYIVSFEDYDMEDEKFSKDSNFWLDYIQPKLIFYNHLVDKHPVSEKNLPEFYVVGEILETEVDEKGILAKYVLFDEMPEPLKKRVDKWSTEVEMAHNYWLKRVQEKHAAGKLGFSSDGAYRLSRRESDGKGTQIKSWAMPFVSLTPIPAEPSLLVSDRKSLPDSFKGAAQPLIQTMMSVLGIDQMQAEQKVQMLLTERLNQVDMPPPQAPMPPQQPIQEQQPQQENPIEEMEEPESEVEEKPEVNPMKQQPKTLESMPPKNPVANPKPKSEYETLERKSLKMSDIETLLKEIGTLKEDIKSIKNPSKGASAYAVNDEDDDEEVSIVNKDVKFLKKNNTPLLNSIRAISQRNFRDMKALGINAGSTGGYMVPEEQSNEIIEAIITKSIFMNGGDAESRVRFLPMSGDTLTIPAVESGGTTQWLGENQEITASQPDYGQRRLVAKKLAMLIPVSNELMRDSNPRFETTLRNDMTRIMTRDVDRAMLSGAGGSEILGLANIAGVNKVALNAVPTYENLVDVIGRFEDSDIDSDDSMAWIFRPSIKNALRKMKDGANQYIWTDTGVIPQIGASQANSLLLGYNYIASNSVLQGTGTNANNESNIYFGKWSDMVVGMNMDIEIVASDVAGDAFKYDQTWIRAIMRLDMIVTRPQAFQILTDVRAS